ncbi:MAG: tetratricopeptide repeat-containing glycosyltransferase family protein [Acetobacteraceae bacterium]|nr:tetratricopeptide repeat-containing glycosyltransferase family protein [Acetobacteraceae bacterium]
MAGASSFRLSHSFRLGQPAVVPDAPIAEAAALYAAGNRDAAAACCLDLVARQPRHFEALHMLGVLCCNRRAYADAVGFLRRAERVRQDVGRLYSNLGNAYAGVRLHHQAEVAYRRALALAPQPEASLLTDLAGAVSGAGRHVEAAALYQQALALRPDFSPARYNLARCLAAQDRPAEAAAAFRLVLDAVATDPERQEMVASGLATALGACGDYAAAAALCRSILAQHPDSAPTAWNESLALLCLGRYAEGWAAYEARWRVANHDPPPPGSAVLDLAAVDGRDVLVLPEQGRGDLLQFARYAPMLAARGARVTLQVYRDVAPVLAALPGVRVITQEHAAPAADCITPLLSLPLAFGTTAATIPAEVPYLHVPPDRMAAWQARLGARVQPRIGLAWRGLQHIPYRSMAPAMLAPLLAVGGCAFHALQKDITPSDRDWLARHGVAEHSAALEDFGDTAALVSLMDLVITIDTAVAHLAGGLGAASWVMLPFNADWRWLTEREDCPWYPTVRLFRQPTAGDWADVVARVADALRQRLESEATVAQRRGSPDQA